MSPPVLLEQDDGLVEVILNRPQSRNALNLQMCHALRDTFERLDGDDTVQVVLVRAAGAAFCAGADLRERTGKEESWVRRRRLAAFAAYDAIERCSKPVIALVAGPVIGSGGEIALACDFVIAASDATFQFPEAHRGTVGATQRLQRVIGKRRAKELLFTGRVVTVEEAERIGLVVRSVEPAHLLAEGRAIADQIRQANELAITLTKQAVDLGAETDLARGIRIELAAIERVLVNDSWRSDLDRFWAARDDVRSE